MTNILFPYWSLQPMPPGDRFCAFISGSNCSKIIPQITLKFPHNFTLISWFYSKCPLFITLASQNAPCWGFFSSRFQHQLLLVHTLDQAENFSPCFSWHMLYRECPLLVLLASLNNIQWSFSPHQICPIDYSEIAARVKLKFQIMLMLWSLTVVGTNSLIPY